MGNKKIINETVGQEILKDYLDNLPVLEIYLKYREYASSSTISRFVKRSIDKKDMRSSKKAFICNECGDSVYRKGQCAKHYRLSLAKQKGNCNVENCNNLQEAKGMCSLHYQRFSTGKPLIKDTACWMNANGYICEYLPDHIQANKDGRVLQHRRIMAEHIGRRLESFENVHHIDGDKTNNDIQNLELWVKMQPSGQRVSDLIEFAKRILEKYN